MLLHVSEFHSLLMLNNIPLYIYTTFCLSIHPSIDIWVVPIFCLLQMLLHIGIRYLFESLFSILLLIYPQVELLDHMVIICLIFFRTTILFSTATVPFNTLTSNGQRFQFLQILNIFCVCC